MAAVSRSETGPDQGSPLARLSSPSNRESLCLIYSEENEVVNYNFHPLNSTILLNSSPVK